MEVPFSLLVVVYVWAGIGIGVCVDLLSATDGIESHHSFGIWGGLLWPITTAVALAGAISGLREAIKNFRDDSF